MSEVLPLLYLHGLSTSDFGPALEQFLGSGAGLSATTITRLTTQWQDEAKTFAGRDLSGTDYVYLWVDGIHLKVRLDQEKLCLLVMIGVRADGRKELVALSDGYRESTESWADVLRDCRRRGMTAPVLAVGEGALGSGKRCARCSQLRVSNAAGFTSRPMFLPHCRNQRIPRRRRRSRISTTPPTSIRRRSRSKRSRSRLRRQVSQSGRQDRRRRRCAPGVLQIPGRALDSSAHHQPHRIDVCHCAVADKSHQRARLPCSRDCHGLQAH